MTATTSTSTQQALHQLVRALDAWSRLALLLDLHTQGASRLRELEQWVHAPRHPGYLGRDRRTQLQELIEARRNELPDAVAIAVEDRIRTS